MENKEVYGGAIQITPQLLMQLLRIKGDLVHIESDPISRCFKLYVKGGAGEFPKVAEGVITPRMKAEYLCSNVGDVPIVNRVTLVNVEDGSEFIHYNECDQCQNGTHLIKISDGEGQISKISYTQPRACLGSPQCRYSIQTKELETRQGVAQEPPEKKKCLYISYLECERDHKCEGCMTDKLQPKEPEEKICDKCMGDFPKNTSEQCSSCSGEPTDRCRSYGMPKCRFRSKYVAEKEEEKNKKKVRCPFDQITSCTFPDCVSQMNECFTWENWKKTCMDCAKTILTREDKPSCYKSSRCRFRNNKTEIEQTSLANKNLALELKKSKEDNLKKDLETVEGVHKVEIHEKKGVESKWYCPFSPANLCGQANCKDCSKFKDWKRLCKDCDGYSKEHLGDKRPKNTCYESSKCKFRDHNHAGDGLELMELVRKIENDELVQLLPNCRFYPQSWSCSFPETECKMCFLKRKADTDMCKTCGQDHGQCKTYGISGCKFTPKYLGLQEQVMCKVVANIGCHRADRDCNVCDNNLVENKGDETKNETSEKEDNKCIHAEGDCTSITEREKDIRCQGCKVKQEADKKKFQCPYNPKWLCDRAPKSVGGLDCISCDKREPKE